MTINYISRIRELCNEETMQNEEMSQRPHKHAEGCTTWDKTTYVSQKVTIKVSLHDFMMKNDQMEWGGATFKMKFMGEILENMPPI